MKRILCKSPLIDRSVAVQILGNGFCHLKHLVPVPLSVSLELIDILKSFPLEETLVKPPSGRGLNKLVLDAVLMTAESKSFSLTLMIMVGAEIYSIILDRLNQIFRYKPCKKALVQIYKITHWISGCNTGNKIIMVPLPVAAVYELHSKIILLFIKRKLRRPPLICRFRIPPCNIGQHPAAQIQIRSAFRRGTFPLPLGNDKSTGQCE